MAREYVLQPFRREVNLQIDYQKELNAQQYAAVTAPPGPALVLAGAGAGKTRTLTYRVAYLIEQGVPANRILLLTFTNKAAREMMRRVSDLLGSDLADLWGGTFHSIGYRILRRHADRVGYRNNFTILDRDDAKELLKTCLAEADIDTGKTRFPKADVLLELISLAINTRQSIGEALASQYPYFALHAHTISELATRYQERKRATNVMDFDDLLVLWLQLLEQDQEVRESYQRRFQFVLVDEYQDTNRIQAELIDTLAARHKNITVVGDDSQSIYSWRGANFKNILDFPKRYPNAGTYKIEMNYRSTPEILELANAAISANVEQFPKQLTPACKSGMKPVAAVCSDASQQAAFIAQRVLELRDEGRDLNNMAVLYRSHFHALELQLELTRRNIPFSITSGIRFFEQAHLKDLTAYLKFVCNPRDELSFKRLVQLLPGIGGKGADKLWKQFTANLNASGWVGGTEPAPVEVDDLDVPVEKPTPEPTPQPPPSPTATPSPAPLATALQQCASAVPKKADKAWTNFAVTISQLEAPSVRQHPHEMMRVVMEAGYDDYLKENYQNYRTRLEDLEQLANFAMQFKSTEEFLTQLSLLTNIEADEERTGPRDDEQLRLSTIHQAKGLEFDVVFVIMLAEGLFPTERAKEKPENIEEERRLFYVAVTRARHELYLSFPLTRMSVGYGGTEFLHASRFLNEIPAHLVEEWNMRG